MCPRHRMALLLTAGTSTAAMARGERYTAYSLWPIPLSLTNTLESEQCMSGGSDASGIRRPKLRFALMIPYSSSSCKTEILPLLRQSRFTVGSFDVPG